MVYQVKGDIEEGELSCISQIDHFLSLLVNLLGNYGSLFWDYKV